MHDSDPSRPTLSVVMPAYNELLTLREILRRVDQVPIDKEIVVVDDCSTDGTRDLLATLERRWPEEDHPHSTLRAILLPQNGGKGRAVRAGIAAARGRITLIQDADLEYDPNDYPKLVGPILEGKADVVYGSRFVGTPRRVLYFWHSLGNKVLTTVSNMLTDLNLTDMETCYKAFRTEQLQAIPLREDRFGFEPEVTAKVARLGLRIYEVPIAYHGRSYAEGKKIGWKDGVEAFRVMLRYRLQDDVADAAIGRQTLEVLKRTGGYNTWLFRQLQPHLGRRVLEVGSGIGNLSRLLLDRERAVLTDLDPDYLLALERDFGAFENVTVTPFDLRQPPSPTITAAKVDTVFSCNVLEHVEDDLAALRHMRQALVPGGRLVLLVPAHPFAYGTLDRGLDHFRRYDRQTLRDRLTAAGFEVESLYSLNALGLAGWFVNGRLLKRRQLPRNQVGLMDRLLPLLDAERRLELPFGLSLVAVARAGAGAAASAGRGASTARRASTTRS